MSATPNASTSGSARNPFAELVAFHESITASPPVLYHYTDQVRFEGILRTRVLRATHIQYLNDSAEYRWAADVARSVIAERSPRLNSQARRVAETFERDLMKLSAKAPVHVTSMSEHRDQLSQWRAYCPAGSGYSLGFRGPVLQERLRGKNVYLVKCVYRASEQRMLINDLVDNAIRLTERLQGDPSKIITALFAQFSFIASVLKHPKFREEKEWRLLAYPRAASFDGKMQFRPGRSMLVPF